MSICQSLQLRAQLTDKMSKNEIISRLLFYKFWGLNMTLVDILRRFLQQQNILGHFRRSLYMTEYFLIIEYVRKSMRNNIMKIYQKPLFITNILKT